MMVGQAIHSMTGHVRVVQKHFEKLANAAAILQALTERSAPERADWCSRRLDGFLAHVIDEAASDARKLHDAVRATSDEKAISIYRPKIVDGKFDLSNSKFIEFYKACCKIDHSFRISIYSTLSELSTSLGASKIPKRTEKLSKLRMIVGESKDDGLFCIELKNYADNIEPFLKNCKDTWKQSQLKLDPQGTG
ncbi:hypothetical protein [Bosea caraganae]|uniref:hypothetical protein n=1 Tax=Bosea caraganae TaxID=2763117 RepID=UPI0011C04FE1|nr:hypothetical protein [Bosea caraganae]